MTPNWLVRLNAVLAWLNPVLGLTAAAERMPVRTPAQAPLAAPQPAPASCARAALPPEWQELSRYD